MPSRQQGGGCSLPIGRWCLGIPIQLHWTFFLLLVLELIHAIFNVNVFGYTILVIVLYGPVLLLTIVIHELGHAWMNKKYGGSAEKIVLWPLGGYVVLGRTNGGVMEDFWVALAGPLTHIPMAGVWFALYCILDSPRSFNFAAVSYTELETVPGWFATLFESAVLINGVVFVFNLFIPAYPLDGGRCLAALLVSSGVAVPRAAMITSATAMVLAGCMIAYGVYSIIVQSLGGIMFILIGVFILFTSHALWRMTRAGQVYAHPLFARDCYQSSAGGSTATAGMSGTMTNPSNRASTTDTIVTQETMQSNTVAAAVDNSTAMNQNGDTEMANYSWTNTTVTAPANHETSPNVADRLRSGMGRMFRKDSKPNAAPDLTI